MSGLKWCVCDAVDYGRQDILLSGCFVKIKSNLSIGETQIIKVTLLLLVFALSFTSSGTSIYDRSEILKIMNRKYTREDYLCLIDKIRKKIPEIQFGTDIIVGFPGETEAQFENTVDLCKQVGFIKGYINKYSPRSGTASFKFKDDVSSKEKKRRWSILNKLINTPKK